jgi:hypothetical protein
MFQLGLRGQHSQHQVGGGPRPCSGGLRLLSDKDRQASQHQHATLALLWATTVQYMPYYAAVDANTCPACCFECLAIFYPHNIN